MLALIAGEGRLPGLVCRAAPRRPFVAALENHLPDGVPPDLTFRIETLGTLLATLRDRDVTEVCFAGSIRRPELETGRIDALTEPLVERLTKALGAGDDAALRIVMAIFEDAGFHVRAAQEIAPGLVPGAAVLTAREPEEGRRTDAARAAAIVARLGTLDVGQGCVVKDGQALAMEGIFGTDWMLASLCSRPDGTGGILYKAPKPGQDRRADLPVIGADTVRAAAAAGLDGIVIEAGGVMIVDREDVVREADARGLFVWARAP